MNVSAWSIKNPIPATMLFILMSLAGIASFNSMKIQHFPDLELPTVNVSATLPGSTPEQLENEVARKIENSIASLQGLKHIYTTIGDGYINMTVEFHLEKPAQEALDDVQASVARVRGDLPAELHDPIINKLEFSRHPVLAFAITSNKMDDEALSWFVDNDITKCLISIPGVGAVNRVGGVSREVRVSLDPVRMQSLGITAAEISHQLRQVQTESVSGRLNLGKGEQPIRTVATVHSADELRALRLGLSSGYSVRLDQVATINDTFSEPRVAALLDGNPVIGFEITRSLGASELEIGSHVRQALKKLQAAQLDLNITEAFDFITPIQEEYDSSCQILLEGSLLAILVVWLFLRDLRATLVAAVALPMSILPTFIGIYEFGFSINSVTLLALSLVIGILVDDAIVEIENIIRHLHMGKMPYEAAMEASNEIGLAVIATTFTLMAVFLPTAFMSGITGKFFKQFGWTAALAVFSSLIVARILTPMMAAYIINPMTDKWDESRWLDIYKLCVIWCIRHRLLTIFLSSLFFISSLALVPLLPKGFIPPDDNCQTQVYLESAPGTTLNETQIAAEQVRLRLMQIDHIKSIYATIGGGSVGGDPFAPHSTSEVRNATLTIHISPRGIRPNKQIIEKNIRNVLTSIPGIRTKVGLGGSGDKYILMLKGDEPQALLKSAHAVERDLLKLQDLGSVTSTASLIRPEIIVHPNFSRAADLGVTSSAIADTLRVATLGDYDTQLPKINLLQRQVPILVKLDDIARRDLHILSHLAVPGVKGLVPLAQVATLSYGSGPAVIKRYDRSRNINIEIDLSGIPLGNVVEAVKKLPSIQNLIPGVRLVEVGDAEVMNELFTSFSIAMLTGALCIYIVLVLLFKQFLHPLTILAALPLSLVGALIGLLIGQKSLSISSLIGLIMLMGIATKNSILLVEYALVARRNQGLSRFDALIDAGYKRARPIIMTSLAMGAGMLPIALGWGSADGSFRSPMALVVICGLITSTLLSLLVVPALFTYIDDFEQWLQHHSSVLLRSG